MLMITVADSMTRWVHSSVQLFTVSKSSNCNIAWFKEIFLETSKQEEHATKGSYFTPNLLSNTPKVILSPIFKVQERSFCIFFTLTEVEWSYVVSVPWGPMVQSLWSTKSVVQVCVPFVNFACPPVVVEPWLLFLCQRKGLTHRLTCCEDWLWL